MANQNIGTPRFYIDELSWLKSSGVDINISQTSGAWHTVSGEMNNLFGLNPSNGVEIAIDGTHGNDTIYIVNSDFNFTENQYYYVAVLGHNFKSFNGWYRLDAYGGTPESGAYPTQRWIINGIVHTSYGLEPDFNGFSIAEYFSQDTDRWRFQINPIGASNYLNEEEAEYTGNLKIGSIVLGRYYDMPHSPELSLTMSHEYDGIKRQETAGGSTLSYADYYKPPDWGNLQAWQLDGWDRKYSGRRVWDLAFKYLSDEDIEPYNYIVYPTHSEYKDNWFTNVIHYTNGGQLPFIFCPDPARYDSNGTLISGTEYSESTRTIPEFAICRFDMKTFKREQVANGVYNIKVKIKESW